MKVFISFPFKNGPWGGGNQFLKGLKEGIQELGYGGSSIKESDIILFNSHHFLSTFNFIKWLKFFHQIRNKTIIHRIDGPIYLIRNRDFIIDYMIFYFAKNIATGVIFQSEWSKEQCNKLGIRHDLKCTTLHNASNSNVFRKREPRPLLNDKIKIIITSWSSNMRKGFKIYKYLDENLDFEKYQVTFIGNTPCKFTNIIVKEPLPSEELALELKKSDMYLTASQQDPCSNSLIEALTVGLPSIVLNDGGHPELVKRGGETFNNTSDVISKIEIVAHNIQKYSHNISVHTLEETVKKYYSFMSQCPKRKSIKVRHILALYFLWLTFKIKDYLYTRFKK